jgi:hypothetical protein
MVAFRTSHRERPHAVSAHAAKRTCRKMIRRLILLWAHLKYWWETRHERAAYSRMFKDRSVRTHPRSTLERTRVTDRDVND